MKYQKNITHKKGLLHVETPLGIVNIYVGMNDYKGRRVESIELCPDQYLGENKVVLRGSRFIELKTKCRGHER